jgi:phosphoribosylformylglycinamidine synthase
VAGIAGYGNCVGVPTVGGEVDFHPRYSGNPLVNAMCVGILRMEDLTTAEAKGVGNPVIYLGSATGKDGIHGATFASAELDEQSESKRPNVQIGDPFAEKLLIEATLEALKTGAVVAIQDMGAAGLTCSTIEMSSKGEVGMEIDLDLVPMRETDMTGYELMLSESQERMLAVAYRGRENEVIDVFRKWGLHAVVIGHVTDDGLTTIRRHGNIEAQVQAAWLADNCPTYHPPAEEPEYHSKAKAFDPSSLPATDLHDALLKLLASPTIASKRWVYRQYDQEVQTQTAISSGEGDAAVIAPRGTTKGLALKIDGNARHTYFDPYVGGQLAVVEAARNVACVGGKPVAVTDGLNFGSPEDPHVFWQFRNAVKGIADAAEAMETPVISGNVSFYNESELGEVPPTPLIGMLGILPDASRRVGLAPKSESGDLYLVETPVELRSGGLGASAYLAEIHQLEDGLPTAPNLAGEARLCDLLVEAIHEGVLEAAHDTSEGGLAVALAEMVIASNRSFDVDLTAGDQAEDCLLFGEAPGRVIVAVAQRAAGEKLAKMAGDRHLQIRRIGSFGPGFTLGIDLNSGRLLWDGANLWHNHCSTIERLINLEA